MTFVNFFIHTVIMDALEEFNGCPEKAINEGRWTSWNTPFILRKEGLNQFHRFPKEPSDIIEFIIGTFKECEVPISKDNEVKEIPLNDWIHREDKQWYLKDWHINSTCKGLGIPDVFQTPEEFPDWFNEFHRSSNQFELDFQFLYWGHAGTVTKYHQDVLGTFSWSHNLCGKKLWKFYMHDEGNGPVVITTIQEPGETVFVPSGCFHIVENLVDNTISINQNWFNEHNIMHVAKRLVSDSLHVSNELIEFGVSFDTRDEFADRIALIVKSNNSLNIYILATIFQYKLHGSQSVEVKTQIKSVVDFLQLHNHLLSKTCIDRLSSISDKYF